MKNKTMSKKEPIGKAEGNKYDKIFKENLQALLPALIHKVLKINILRMENLPEIRVQTTKEAEPDFLKKVFTDEHPDGCILQIELEAKDERNIDAKALYYIAAEYLKFQVPIDLRMIPPEGQAQAHQGRIKLLWPKTQVSSLLFE